MSKATPEELERLNNYKWNKSDWRDLPPHPMIERVDAIISQQAADIKLLREALDVADDLRLIALDMGDRYEIPLKQFEDAMARTAEALTATDPHRKLENEND